MASSDPHAWRDTVLGAGDQDAAYRSSSRWYAEIEHADNMGWLTTEHYRTAHAELEADGRVWSAAVARQEAEDAEYERGAQIAQAVVNQGLSRCPVGRAA